MPSLEENYKEWNDDWDPELDGDEWTDQAEYCKQPYVEWKKSLVDAFIGNYVDKNSTVLEIGPGHGRWTEYIVGIPKKLILVDIGPKCLEICRKRFSDYANIEYILNNGKSLGRIDDSTIDFVWSYDSFIFMEKDVFESYFKEFRRILRPKGVAVIHHAATNRIVETLRRRGGVWWRIASMISPYNISNDDGGRSMISINDVNKIAQRSNLKIIRQVDCWGEKDQYNCKRFGDVISIIS